MLKRIVFGAGFGGVLGAASFGSIAAVAHGGWSPLEAAVIGFWILFGVGAFFGTMPD